jgi:hypothetical protein
MLKNNIPKNGAKEDHPRIEPLTSRFPHSDLDLDFLNRKFQIRVQKHCKTIQCFYSYRYILLLKNLEIELEKTIKNNCNLKNGLKKL